MTSAIFDTLKFARTLRERAKLSPDVATKGDILSVRADLRETELRLKAEIEASKAEIVKWMFGTIGFQTLIVLGAVIALSRAVQP